MAEKEEDLLIDFDTLHVSPGTPLFHVPTQPLDLTATLQNLNMSSASNDVGKISDDGKSTPSFLQKEQQKFPTPSPRTSVPR